MRMAATEVYNTISVYEIAPKFYMQTYFRIIMTLSPCEFHKNMLDAAYNVSHAFVWAYISYQITLLQYKVHILLHWVW